MSTLYIWDTRQYVVFGMLLPKACVHGINPNPTLVSRVLFQLPLKRHYRVDILLGNSRTRAQGHSSVQCIQCCLPYP